MRRFLVGSAVTLASILAGPSYLIQTLLSLISRMALMLNEQTVLMMSLAMLLMLNRAPVLISTAWTGIKTRITNMHFFVGGAALVLFSIVVLSFLPGTFFITTLQALFSAGSLTGYQILQGLVFVVGVIFIIFDFPYGYVKGMRRMR
jgi:hypothetical protein